MTRNTKNRRKSSKRKGKKYPYRQRLKAAGNRRDRTLLALRALSQQRADSVNFVQVSTLRLRPGPPEGDPARVLCSRIPSLKGGPLSNLSERRKSATAFAEKASQQELSTIFALDSSEEHSSAKIGRPKGSRNKATMAWINRARAKGITPVEYMLEVMRDDTINEDGEPNVSRDERMEAARAAAPYVHPSSSDAAA